jgi:hypothetical protein
VSSLTVKEGSTGQLGIRLSSAPPGNVTVTISQAYGNAGLAVAGATSVTFTPANFATVQNVTISAANDSDSLSSDAVFRIDGNGLSSVMVPVTGLDKDALF